MTGIESWRGHHAALVERRLDADLARLVDAAMAGDRPGALVALADAQVHGLVEHRAPALAWVLEQSALVELLPDAVADAVDGDRLLGEVARQRRKVAGTRGARG